MKDETLLRLEGLRANVGPPGRGLPILRDVSFDLAGGEVLGIIGESGSGKTMTMMAILRLLPEQIHAQAHRLEFAGIDLQALGPREFAAFRGTRLAMVFQDPTGAFNPAKTLGWHLRAVMRRAGTRSPALAERAAHWKPAAMQLLRDVGITRDSSFLRQYPHQLSGGMLQRALIAVVLALEPELIVADEPTTNLDNIVERQIVELFREIKSRISSAMIFITHDIAIARVICDRIAVMYAGQIVEIGRTQDIVERPLHPYTRSLIAASTELDLHPHRLTEIAGEGPVLSGRLDCCAFETRCPVAHPPCREADPGLRRRSETTVVRCVLYDPI